MNEWMPYDITTNAYGGILENSEANRNWTKTIMYQANDNNNTRAPVNNYIAVYNLAIDAKTI